MKNINSELIRNFHRIKLVKILQITKFVKQFDFEIPLDLIGFYQFKAGQYIAIKLKINGDDVIKNFSLLPKLNNNIISIAMKINPNNIFHEQMISSKIGSDIEVSQAMGNFYLDEKPNENRTILAFAAGIGISPIFSQIFYILENEIRSNVYLFYANKNQETTAYYANLEDLKIKFPGRLFTYYFYTEEIINNRFFEGRLNSHKLKLIKNQLLDWDEVDKVLICGPNTMIKELANTCLEEGLRQTDIHFEHFNNYNTEVFDLKKNTININNANIEFKFNNIKNTTQGINNQRKLLGQLIEMGFDVPYSCKSGVCGACTCHLELGEVEMTDENEFLTSVDVKKNLILPCISYIKSDCIKLNFDVKIN